MLPFHLSEHTTGSTSQKSHNITVTQGPRVLGDHVRRDVSGTHGSRGRQEVAGVRGPSESAGEEREGEMREGNIGKI